VIGVRRGQVATDRVEVPMVAGGPRDLLRVEADDGTLALNVAQDALRFMSDDVRCR